MKVKVRKANPLHIMTYKTKYYVLKAAKEKSIQVYDPYTNTTLITKREYLTKGEINKILDDVLGTQFGDYDDPTPGPWRTDCLKIGTKLPYVFHNSDPEEA